MIMNGVPPPGVAGLSTPSALNFDPHAQSTPGARSYYSASIATPGALPNKPSLPILRAVKVTSFFNWSHSSTD